MLAQVKAHREIELAECAIPQVRRQVDARREFAPGTIIIQPAIASAPIGGREGRHVPVPVILIVAAAKVFPIAAGLDGEWTTIGIQVALDSPAPTGCTSRASTVAPRGFRGPVLS